MLRFLPVLGLAAALSGTAVQAGTLDEVRQRGTLRIGYAMAKAPFSWRADDGQPTGFSVDLCKRVAAEVARRAGRAIRVAWVPLAPHNRLKAVASKRVDIECGSTTTTLSRRAIVDFSLPIFVDTASLMGRTAVATKIADLNGARIAVTEATTTVGVLERALDKRGITARIARTKTLAEAFQRLRDGEVDAIAGDRTTLVGAFVSGGGGEGLALFDENLSYEPYALALRRGDAQFRLLVDTVLARLYRSGEIDQILRSWLSGFGDPTDVLVTMYRLNGLPE